LGKKENKNKRGKKTGNHKRGGGERRNRGRGVEGKNLSMQLGFNLGKIQQAKFGGGKAGVSLTKKGRGTQTKKKGGRIRKVQKLLQKSESRRKGLGIFGRELWRKKGGRGETRRERKRGKAFKKGERRESLLRGIIKSGRGREGL